MATKLFVGKLSFSTTPVDLEALFRQAGAVASVAIISDKFSGQSRGFGFVEVGSQAEAQTAMAQFNGYELQGRALPVNEAKPQAPRGGGGRGGSDQRW